MTELTTLAVLIPLATALVVATLPRSEPALARALGLLGALVELGVLATLIWSFDPAGPAVQRAVAFPWMPAYGIACSLGVDGRGLAGLAVLGLGFPLALLLGGRLRPGEGSLVLGMLVLEAAWVAVILARDLVTLGAAWELATLATVFLLGHRGDGIAGTPGRISAARRHAAHVVPGAAALIGAIILLGVAHAHATGGAWSWDLDTLASVTLPPATAYLGLALVLFAAATTLPLVPLHRGLVSACVSGPTPVVAVLLGAGMPMAVLLLVRVGLPLFPLAAGEWANPIAALAVAGAVYAGLVCWAEREPGRLLAHLAIVHLGLAVVAAVSGSASAGVGLGPLLIAHALGLAALTCVCHALRRDGVVDLGELAGWAAAAPRSSALALLGALVLMGVPGSIGFVGELGTVVGILSEGELELLRPALLGLLAAAAVVVGVLGALRSFWYASRGPHVGPTLVDLAPRELVAGVAALVLALGLGVASAGLLERSEPAEREAVERFHFARCLAIEARSTTRPRTHEDLRERLGATCLDPVAQIRLYYFGSAGHTEHDSGSAGHTEHDEHAKEASP
ncbi:MAG: proton-conducting transporter membrane subunit [Enhygromyxa sp.]